MTSVREPGTYPIERLPVGWTTIEMNLTRRNGEKITRYQIVHICSGTRYIQEPQWLIACKCMGLFLVAVPAFVCSYTLFHLIRTPIVTINKLSLSALQEQIWTLARTPFYFFALEMAALYGVFKPLEGRALFGEIESQFHDGKTFKESLQYKEPRTLKDFIQAFTEKDYSWTVFIGLCMQARGTINGFVDPLLPNPLSV